MAQATPGPTTRAEMPTDRVIPAARGIQVTRSRPATPATRATTPDRRDPTPGRILRDRILRDRILPGRARPISATTVQTSGRSTDRSRDPASPERVRTAETREPT